MLGVLSVIAGLAVGFWVVKRLFGRNGLFGGTKDEQPADVASFDFYVASSDDDPTQTAMISDRVKARHTQ